MTPLLRRGAALLLVLLLGGCASLAGLWPSRPTPAVADPAAANAAHAARVRAVTDWRLAGRIAVQRADQGVSATLDWYQQGDRFELRVAAPLNGGTFALGGDDRAVSLVTAAGERFTARSAEALMQDHLGWSLPVSGARWWVRGIPAPTPAASQEYFDAQGRWTDFEQHGWRISILDYVAAGDLSLPRKLFLSRADLEVRVVIKSWE